MIRFPGLVEKLPPGCLTLARELCAYQVVIGVEVEDTHVHIWQDRTLQICFKNLPTLGCQLGLVS